MRGPFPVLPRANRSFRGHVARYIKPPRTSFDLATAPEWEHPTALDFQAETITATKLGAAAWYGHELPPIPPGQFVEMIADDLQRMWHSLAANLRGEARVVDADERIGVRFDSDVPMDATSIRADLKTWPAIEGVTTPVSRDTLESTW